MRYIFHPIVVMEVEVAKDSQHSGIFLECNPLWIWRHPDNINIFDLNASTLTYNISRSSYVRRISCCWQDLFFCGTLDISDKLCFDEE